MAPIPAALWPPGDWYAALSKPSWTPPPWVFGPVWTTLYAAMGVAAWRVWRRDGWSVGVGLFLAQLAVNAAWSPVFFGWQQLGAALAVILVLAALIALTVRAFWRSDRLAGALLVPYLAWASFAACLNAALWRLNA